MNTRGARFGKTPTNFVGNRASTDERLHVATEAEVSTVTSRGAPIFETPRVHPHTDAPSSTPPQPSDATLRVGSTSKGILISAGADEEHELPACAENHTVEEKQSVEQSDPDGPPTSTRVRRLRALFEQKHDTERSKALCFTRRNYGQRPTQRSAN